MMCRLRCFSARPQHISVPQFCSFTSTADQEVLQTVFSALLHLVGTTWANATLHINRRQALKPTKPAPGVICKMQAAASRCILSHVFCTTPSFTYTLACLCSCPGVIDQSGLYLLLLPCCCCCTAGQTPVAAVAKSAAMEQPGAAAADTAAAAVQLAALLRLVLLLVPQSPSSRCRCIRHVRCCTADNTDAPAAIQQSAPCT